MTLIFFICGLTYFLLGIIIYVYPKQNSRFNLTEDIWLVACFGLIYGASEWIDMFILINPMQAAVLKNIHLLVSSISFYFLVQFGINTIVKIKQMNPALKFVPIFSLAGWMIITAVSGQKILIGEIAVRYLLCVPGSILTCYAMILHTSELKKPNAIRNLKLAAGSFFFYGFFAGIIVPEAPFFPSSVLNDVIFLDKVGIAVQLFRACCAVIMAYAIGRLLNIFERETTDSLMRSVSRSKHSEEMVPETEERFRTLAEASFEGVVISRHGIIKDCNDQFPKMLGYSKEELIDKPIRDLLPNEAIEMVMQKILTNQESCVDHDLLCKDGSRRSVEAHGKTIMHHGEEFRITAVHDITERRHTEEELIEYRDHLEEIVAERTRELSVLNDQLRQSQKLEAVGLLAGGIAHDFTNILTTIKGSIHVMQKKLDNDSPLMQYAEQILSSVGRASNLTQSLLAFSKKQTIILKPWDFNEIIRSASKLLSQLIGEDIELSMMLTDKNSTVMGDRSQIEQILWNLATNARDAMPRGGTLTVQTEIIEMDEVFRNKHGYGVSGQYVLLAVSDTGTGMDEETKGKIFQPFFTTKELDKGSGLGLAVTYGIVKQHGGYIDVETFPEKGTTFKIYIPVVEKTALRLESPDASSVAGKGETILLAEDDAAAREIMAEVLRLSGYKVIEAADGEDAVKLFRDEKDGVDLVLLDVRMPKKDGREVYEEIMKVSPKTVVLFMSGYTKDIIDSQSILGQGLHFISKAASPEEILKKIREVIDKQKNE